MRLWITFQNNGLWHQRQLLQTLSLSFLLINHFISVTKWNFVLVSNLRMLLMFRIYHVYQGFWQTKADHGGLESILSTLYEQLLRSQIPKVLKDCQVVSRFYTFRICPQKNYMYNIDEIDTWALFHQHSMYSFYAYRSQKCKKILIT